MNSRERRKLEAIQHNDAIRYNDWLVKNTLDQTRNPEVSIYRKARRAGLTMSAALNLAYAVAATGVCSGS